MCIRDSHSPWQAERNVGIVLPNWREYGTLAEPANAADLADTEAPSVVKVHGPEDAVQEIVAEIAQMVAERQRTPRRGAAAEAAAADARIDDA